MWPELHLLNVAMSVVRFFIKWNSYTAIPSVAWSKRCFIALVLFHINFPIIWLGIERLGYSSPSKYCDILLFMRDKASTFDFYSFRLLVNTTKLKLSVLRRRQHHLWSPFCICGFNEAHMEPIVNFCPFKFTLAWIRAVWCWTTKSDMKLSEPYSVLGDSDLAASLSHIYAPIVVECWWFNEVLFVWHTQANPLFPINLEGFHVSSFNVLWRSIWRPFELPSSQCTTSSGFGVVPTWCSWICVDGPTMLPFWLFIDGDMTVSSFALTCTVMYSQWKCTIISGSFVSATTSICRGKLVGSLESFTFHM